MKKLGRSILLILIPSCFVENLIQTFLKISVFSLNLSKGLSGLLKLSSNYWTSTSIKRLSMTKVINMTKIRKNIIVMLLAREVVRKVKGKRFTIFCTCNSRFTPFDISRLCPQIHHNSLPILTSWTPEKCCDCSPEILKINNLIIDLCSKSYILKQEPG